jgi:hypothetical protein
MDFQRVHSFQWSALILTTAFLCGRCDPLSAEFWAQTGDTARTSPIELRTYIAQFTGADATDCGQYFLVRPLTAPGIEEMRRFLSCGLDAAKRRKPFWTLKQEQGFDSLVFQGLLGTAEGTIFRFSYDTHHSEARVAPDGSPSSVVNGQRWSRTAINARQTSGASHDPKPIRPLGARTKRFTAFLISSVRTKGDDVAPAHRATSEWTLWIVAVSCALHAAEEYLTGWHEWARQTLGIVMPTTTFVVMNAVLVVAALLLARVGWRQPALSLVIPSATLVNAVCFHILPTILQGRVSPGVYTAAVLYLPFSSWALLGAARDDVPRTAIGTAVVAGALLAVGVVLGARSLTSAAGYGR